MFVSGIAVSAFGPTDLSLPQLLWQTADRAVRDAGLDWKDIDAAYVANNLSQLTHNQSHLSAVLAGYLPGRFLPIFNIEAACASGGVAVHQACLSLKTYQRILVVGVEKMTDTASADLLTYVASDGDRLLDQREGVLFPTAGALIAGQYLQKYDATLDDLTNVAVKNHANANQNPRAQFHTKTVDADMVNNSRVICSPLRLFDCSPTSDGAAAVVLEQTKRTPRARKILASSFVTNRLHFAGEKDLTDRKELQACAKQAYIQSGLKPADIQFAELHDGFTVMELIAMENLGFCGPGKAPELTRWGETARTGSLPVNPSGGLKACGHPLGATGVRQIADIVEQLRGEADDRQVPNNDVGIAVNIGSLIGSATVHILS
jgi:acetyl-CoA C-acetyltransferase